MKKRFRVDLDTPWGARQHILKDVSADAVRERITERVYAGQKVKIASLKEIGRGDNGSEVETQITELLKVEPEATAREIADTIERGLNYVMARLNLMADRGELVKNASFPARWSLA